MTAREWLDLALSGPVSMVTDEAVTALREALDNYPYRSVAGALRVEFLRALALRERQRLGARGLGWWRSGLE